MRNLLARQPHSVEERAQVRISQLHNLANLVLELFKARLKLRSLLALTVTALLQKIDSKRLRIQIAEFFFRILAQIRLYPFFKFRFRILSIRIAIFEFGLGYVRGWLSAGFSTSGRAFDSRCFLRPRIRFGGSLFNGFLDLILDFRRHSFLQVTSPSPVGRVYC